MNYQMTFTGMDSGPAVVDYVNEKIVALLERFAQASGRPEVWRGTIELGRETEHHKKGAVWFIEVGGQTAYGLIRARENGTSIYEAIDLLHETLQAQLVKSKDKILSRADRAARRIKNMMRLSRFARFFRKGRIRNEGL